MRAVLTVALGLALCAALGAKPAAAATGSIAGTVTDAGSHEGVVGIWVCANGPMFGPIGGCETTDSEGKYKIEGLQSAYYVVVFEEEGRKNYLAQWYNGKSTKSSANAVNLGDGEAATGIDAALAVGGQIAGTVTNVETLEPVEGVEACAIDVSGPQEEGVIHCDKSDAAGEYTIHALKTGSYKVEFFVWESPNYIHQFYPGKASRAEASTLAVTAGSAPVTGIDAAMQRGIQVSGTVTEAGGSGLTWEARVCAVDPVTEAVAQCDFPGHDGTYSIAGLSFGLYAISFAVDVEEEPGLILHPDGFVRQYYDAKPTLAEADRIGGAGPAELTGIDAQLVRGPEVFPNRRPQPVPPVVFPGEWSSPPRVLKCRKGTRKKWVRGQRRCVKKPRKHRRHRHHRRHHHRHGQAAGR